MSCCFEPFDFLLVFLIIFYVGTCAQQYHARLQSCIHPCSCNSTTFLSKVVLSADRPFCHQQQHPLSSYLSIPDNQRPSVLEHESNLVLQLQKEVNRRCSFNLTTGDLDHPKYSLVLTNLMKDTTQLQRILDARNHQIGKAADLVFEQVNFRLQWNPSQISPSMIPNALKSGAFRLCGYSKKGHVIINFQLRYWDPNVYGARLTGVNGEIEEQEQKEEYHDQMEKQREHADDNRLQHHAVQEFVRYVVYVMELAIGSYMKPPPMPDKFVVLLDLRAFSWNLVVSSRVRHMISKLIDVAQSQYPERLAKVYLLYAPFGFATAWQVLRPLLHERTAQKVVFSSSMAELWNEIDAQVLTEDCGRNHPGYLVPAPSLQELS